MGYTYAVVGLSHLTTPVEVREKVSLRPEECSAINRGVKAACGLEDVVVLSTCSRFEVYAELSEERIPALVGWFSRRAGMDMKPLLYVRTNRGAVRHLFRVVSGLDSWIVGETEILGQARAAYLASVREGAAGRTSHLAFQRAMYAGKKARSSTPIMGGIASIGGAAAMLARQIFGEASRRSIVVFGAGAMAESTVRHLTSKGSSEVAVANRSLERAQQLARRLGGTPMTMEQGMERLASADIAVFSTGAAEPILTRAQAEAAAKRRGGRALFLVDIAVPRNVDSRAAEAEQVYLYDIDDLQRMMTESLARRKDSLGEADRIVTAESADTWSRIASPRTTLVRYPLKRECLVPA